MLESKMILMVEPKKTTPQALTPEIRESVKSLFFNPGFKFLLNKLALQREYMRGLLETEKDLRLEEFQRLQNGIYWTNWLEHQAYEIAKYDPPKPVAKQLRKSDMDMLEEIRKNITLVGEGTDSATTP